MSVPTRALVAVAAAAALAGGALPSFAADAPKTSATSSSFFLVQDGCGADTGPGRLEIKKLESDSPGCGTIGGVPFDEAFAQLGDPIVDSFDTVGKGLPIVLDATKKVTGQVSAEGWYEGLVPVGGVGTVEADISVVASTLSGASVDFGTTTVSAMGAPGQSVVSLPFTLTAPATANGQKIKSISMSVSLHGANIGYSAYKFGGDSFLVIPTKVVKPAPKKK